MGKQKLTSVLASCGTVGHERASLPVRTWISMLFNRQPALNSLEISEELRSLTDWQALSEQQSIIGNFEAIGRLAAGIVKKGAVEPLSGRRIPPGSLAGVSNLREELVFESINSRSRAVLLCIEQALHEVMWSDAKIYATEAVTPFALKLRGIFAKFIGSEYSESDEQRADLYPIPCEDLQRLSFSSDCFHIVTTNEVLEHVPSIDMALSEIYRVLRPGGWHIGTAPFAMGQQDSILKAKIENGRIVHLMEPEYHGNPVDERGSLVFEVPGWDILDRARAAGFSDAHMKFIVSSKYACLSGDAAGIFVFAFKK